MNLNQAIKLAIQALEICNREEAFTANLFLRYGMESGENAFKRVKKRKEAIAVLKSVTSRDTPR